MRHMIMGIPKNDNFPTFNVELPLTAETLKPIMNWETDNEIFFDYQLTPQQINDIEAATSLTFPKELDLFLTCEA